MYRFNFPFFCLCCFFLTASAQRQNTYFIKNNGNQVTQRDSADFIRHVIEPDQGTELYKVKEFYLDGTVRSTGFSSKIDPQVFEGLRTTFFPNGNLKETAHFVKGQQIDTTNSYYPDGKLYHTKVYSLSAKEDKIKAFMDPRVFILTEKDQNGKDLVKDGNGRYIGYTDDFKGITETGQVKNGQHEGVWTGTSNQGSSKYSETYAEGKLISGESTDKNMVIYKYTEAFILPGFKGGTKKFYRYLASHVKYPPNCYKARIQGVVKIKFTIEKDGNLTNITAINSVHPDLAAEAIRVIRDSPQWEPGKTRGEPVKVVYNIPVSFNLQ